MGFALSILETFADILYADGWTPLILIGVPTSRLWSVKVVTVTWFDGVKPSPAWIWAIFTGSLANAPTISYSALREANPSKLDGNFSVILLVDEAL